MKQKWGVVGVVEDKSRAPMTAQWADTAADFAGGYNVDLLSLLKLHTTMGRGNKIHKEEQPLMEISEIVNHAQNEQAKIRRLHQLFIIDLTRNGVRQNHQELGGRNLPDWSQESVMNTRSYGH
ncbi:hypothetical protein PM082_007764 [Marasmius tenuissimus]|nr:hypothetical protein PM082_007764 [Marasmius tenuissimus]